VPATTASSRAAAGREKVYPKCAVISRFGKETVAQTAALPAEEGTPPDNRRWTPPAPTDLPLAARLDAALPADAMHALRAIQTAAATRRRMADGSADINRCPPGGAEGMRALAAIQRPPVLPLDPTRGSEGPRALAVIDEAGASGCTTVHQGLPGGLHRSARPSSCTP